MITYTITTNAGRRFNVTRTNYTEAHVLAGRVLRHLDTADYVREMELTS